MSIIKCYPGGFRKAMTFSYDDGTMHDMKQIELMNEYGLRGTFNLMAHNCKNDRYSLKKGTKLLWGNRVGELKKLYKNHEVAGHSLTHPHLEELELEELAYQIGEDKRLLSEVFGYEIKGFAYPYGSYNDKVVEVLKQNELVYARTTESTLDFTIPEDFLRLTPSCKHTAFEDTDIAERFFETEQELALLFIWGHSFEFGDFDKWEWFEELCKKLSGNSDVWYCTNTEVMEYLAAAEQLILNEVFAENPTETEIWFKKRNKVYSIKPHEILSL